MRSMRFRNQYGPTMATHDSYSLNPKMDKKDFKKFFYQKFNMGVGVPHQILLKAMARQMLPRLEATIGRY